VHDTATERLSLDDAIIDYFSKKSIADQTEKLALARLASKMETSIDQVQMSVNRLSAKNLIRKIYSQGKIGFELTPKGKSAIAVLAKAQTDRVTKQLQEAIQQERKTKLRTDTINKMTSVGDKWQNYQVPDTGLIAEIQREAAKLLEATKEIENKQPLCNTDPQNYDQKYTQYKLQIENLIKQNNYQTKSINNYSKIKENQLSISNDIEKISKIITKYEVIAEATIQVSQLKNTLDRLKTIDSLLENFDKKQLSQLEELKFKLTENSRLLENLKKPTHEFVPSRRESATGKLPLYPDPEGPIKFERKANISSSEEKCGKCGTKRKLTPVDIG
jgi:DNA-binding MarR family transcriptional regulator